MADKICGIYCIENKVNGKKYIGQSINIEQRIKDHLSHLKRNKEPSLALQNAWNKYGENNFNIYILEECKVDLLNEKEIYYIESNFSHTSQQGYNISFGGNAPMKGRIVSKETREKIRISRIGIEFTEEHKRNLSLGQTGVKRKPRSKEHCEKISKNRKGKLFTEEHKKKLSNARRGIKRSSSSLLKFSNTMTGTKRDTSTSKYIGVAYDNKGKRWRCGFSKNGKRINIGSFSSEEEAALEYDKYILENKIDRPLNFPDKKGRN